MTAIVAERALKHGLTEDEILHAWENYVWMQQHEDFIFAVGCTKSGDMVLMLAVIVEGGYHIGHAITPPPARMLKALEMTKS